jgi:hypothetical protein
MRMINPDGTLGPRLKLSETAIILAKIKDEDWTQVITNPAKFTHGPLWK